MRVLFSQTEREPFSALFSKGPDLADSQFPSCSSQLAPPRHPLLPFQLPPAHCCAC